MEGHHWHWWLCQCQEEALERSLERPADGVEGLLSTKALPSAEGLISVKGFLSANRDVGVKTPKVDLAGAVGTVFAGPLLYSSVQRDSMDACGPDQLGSLDLSLAQVLEVLRWSQELCLTPE